MKIFQLIIVVWVLFQLTSCSEEAQNTSCFFIDQRQCQIDPWSDSEAQLGRVDAVKQYLESNGVEAVRFEVEDRFHEVVCLACQCPGGPRYFIEIPDEDVAQLSGLDISSGPLDECF